MAYIITNGIFFISISNTGEIEKVENKSDAKIFESKWKAVQIIKVGGCKTKKYYVLDLDTNTILWRHYRTKKYSETTRKMIYEKYNGKCALCGRKIDIDEMTLDHIVPLCKHGEDSVDNLQCTCFACNNFKANILPEDFNERITTIFLYQMNQKYHKNMIWRIMHKALKNMI